MYYEDIEGFMAWCRSNNTKNNYQNNVIIAFFQQRGLTLLPVDKRAL